jgi:hypothetical protein
MSAAVPAIRSSFCGSLGAFWPQHFSAPQKALLSQGKASSYRHRQSWAATVWAPTRVLLRFPYRKNVSRNFGAIANAIIFNA